MESIAVTKPDMAVTQRDRLGLSLFGLLSLAFGDEVRTRSTWQTGLYREEPLALLEEEEAPARGEMPPLQLNVDLNVVLETLKKEQDRAGKRQEKTVERILERVYLLERQIEQTAPTPHVSVRMDRAPSAAAQAPSHAAGRDASLPQSRAARQSGHAAQPSPAAMQVAQQAARAVQTVQAAAQRKEGEVLARKAIGTQAAAAVQQARQAVSGRGVRTVEQERLGRLASPLTPVGWSTASPVGDGWKPHWQEEHPGFPGKQAQTAQQMVGGSILLPDQLRRRREQALTQAAEQPEETAPRAQVEQRFVRDIAASVQRALDGRIGEIQAVLPSDLPVLDSRQEEPPDGAQPVQMADPMGLTHEALQYREQLSSDPDAPRRAEQEGKVYSPVHLDHAQASQENTSAPTQQAALPVQPTGTAQADAPEIQTEQLAKPMQEMQQAWPRQQLPALEDVQASFDAQALPMAREKEIESQIEPVQTGASAQKIVEESALWATPSVTRDANMPQEALQHRVDWQAEGTTDRRNPEKQVGQTRTEEVGFAQTELTHRVEQPEGAGAQSPEGRASESKPQTPREPERTKFEPAPQTSTAPVQTSRTAEEESPKQARPVQAEEMEFAQAELAHRMEQPKRAGAQSPDGRAFEPKPQVSREPGRTKSEPAPQTSTAPVQTSRTAEKNLMRSELAMRVQEGDEKSARVDIEPLVYRAESQVEHSASDMPGLHQPTSQAMRLEQKETRLRHGKLPASQGIQPQASTIAALRPIKLQRTAEQTAAVRPMQPFTYAPAAPSALEWGTMPEERLPKANPQDSGGELTYLPVQTTKEQTAQPPKKEPAPSTDTGYISTLPDWAQRFLQQPDQAAPNVALPSQPIAQPEQISWTAPNAVSPNAHMVFREAVQHKEDNLPPQPVHLSDGELRRAADRVYRMIEERLRRELRRSGR